MCDYCGCEDGDGPLRWKKIPSVTPGGKSYFWVATNWPTKYWVIWDRNHETWTVTDGKSTLKWVTSTKAGKLYVEAVADHLAYEAGH